MEECCGAHATVTGTEERRRGVGYEEEDFTSPLVSPSLE
jgi:hypothetical protein